MITKINIWDALLKFVQTKKWKLKIEKKQRIENFFTGRVHCTRFGNDISEVAEITASIVQGSSLGPAAYVVAAADLRPRRDDNVIIKYADDTYLIVPSDSNDTCIEELRHNPGVGWQ